MKILHVLASNSFSGAENVVCQIIEMFRNKEATEMLYCSPNGAIAESLKTRSIKFVPLCALNKKELQRVIREECPDIIHAHDMRASFLVYRAAKKIPFISHIHNNAFDSRGLSLKSVAYILAAKKARHIFWVSESAYKGYKFHKFFKKKSSVLSNILDVECLKTKMQEDTNTYNYDIVYVGRLTYPKNPQRLIEILSMVVKKKPDVQIAIVGTGELEDEVKALSKELGIQENINFLGFLKNPLKVMHDAKVMVMSSRWEGVPMCALEGMALGLPIVSTPTDGLQVLIENGVNGFLSEDNIELAEKLCLLIDDEELRRKQSEAQKNKARVVNDIEKYKQILDNHYKMK